MKKILIITNAKGGPGKTLFAHCYRLTLASLRYPPLFSERTPQRLPRLKSKRPLRFKNPTRIFRRH